MRCENNDKKLIELVEKTDSDILAFLENEVKDSWEWMTEAVEKYKRYEKTYQSRIETEGYDSVMTEGAERSAELARACFVLVTEIDKKTGNW